MDDSYRIDELADAVTRLAGAVEEMASRLDLFDATDDPPLARDHSRDRKRRCGDAPMCQRARTPGADPTASSAPQLGLHELCEFLAFALSFEDFRPARDVLSPN